ncbi:MAG: MotA/TolQ/ExbB proton channel family protein [Desulfovibrionaceae bacterium]|nr:MotA/TolQ/ExbB proton channel family protein [Desulfovibrionaceae bacterium]
MDIGTLVGILVGFGLVFGSIMMGPSPAGFLDIPSMMIVIGGTFAAALVSFPLEEVLQAFKASIKTFVSRRTPPAEVVDTMVKVAEISRREGLLALERVQTDNQVLKKALRLIADSADPALISNTMELEIASMKRRHNISIAVLSRMGGLGPAFGMIGTLIGLVQMLTQLDDPATLGPAMAVAILTTFYGSLLANMIFNPLSAKLSARSAQEGMNLMIIFGGAQSILENNNPRFVYEKLSSFLPPKDRKGND